jgi:hypothetical protein
MPYQSTITGALARLLQERGDLTAQQAATSGRLWGGALSTLGQRVATGFADAAQRREDAPRKALEAKEIEARMGILRDATEARTQAKKVERVSLWLTDLAGQADPTQSYQQGRAALIADGTFTPQDAPEFFPGKSWVKARMTQLLPAAERFKQLFPDPEKVMERDPTKDVIDPMTGKVLTPGTPKAPDPFTLAPGQQRFGADGRPIATVPAAPPRPVSVPEGGLLVDPITGKTIVQGPPKREPRGPQTPTPIIDPETGQTIYVRPDTAIGQRVPTTRENATEDERKTAGFYSQMTDAIKIMDELESSLSQKELYQIQTLPQEGLIGLANRGELSENAKRYLRAFEQFTESRLRPVSGAAIADTEYERDRRTYAKQYGETPKLSEDRKRARQGAQAALKTRAGRALPKDTAAAPVAPAKRLRASTQ